MIALLTPVAESEPSDRTVAYLLGSALIGDGQPDQGQVIIDRVFRDDNSAEARLLMGSILLLADDGLGAIKEFERALDLNPKLPTLRAWYGRALMRMGDGEQAKRIRTQRKKGTYFPGKCQGGTDSWHENQKILRRKLLLSGN